MTPILLSLTIFASMTALVTQRKHLLMSLLCLEAMILMLVNMMVFTYGTLPFMNPFLFIVLLTFGACEASLGLALLVIMMRTFGSDTMNLMNMMKC